MDANGLRSFGLSYRRGLSAWPTIEDDQPARVMVESDSCHRIEAVRLASRAQRAPFSEVPASAGDVVLMPSIARDRFGNYVVWDAASATLYSVSAASEEHPELLPVPVPLPATAMPVRDLALGADDVLYVAGGDGLWLIDMRARFEPLRVPTDFVAHRVAADREQGAWVLDVISGRIARVTGLPPFTTGVDLLRERNDRFEAVEMAQDPLRIHLLPAQLPAGERAVALVIGAEFTGVLAVGPERARLRALTESNQWSAAIPFDGPRFAHSVAMLDDHRFVVIGNLKALAADGVTELDRDLGAFSYRLEPDVLQRAREFPATAVESLPALGDYYPLPGRMNGPFANVAPNSAEIAYFPRRRSWRLGGGVLELPEPAPLARLSLAARAVHGIVANFERAADGATIRNALGVVDSHEAATEWHRLYIEASVPRGTAMLIWLAANDGPAPAFTVDPTARTAEHAATWFPHVVGDLESISSAALLPTATPRAAWTLAESEVGGGQSLVGGTREPGVSGLFTVLVQKAGLTVRTLRGQRLWVVVELFGDSRATPELVMLRAYANRFSYRDRYLPALYREQVYGAEADRPGTATGPDFLERFIDLFEGVFTTVEDRIANAHLVTDVAACPPDALPWLGSWIGFALEDLRGDDATRRARNMLLNASQLARRHGTLDGLRWALDIATDGAVTRGRLVVIENFRLRRTMATILGADLADENDPLTLGITQSGNSFVGDSLFLGDENVKTFLALFRTLMPDPGATGPEAIRQRDEREAALHALYDGLAQRATVLVHEMLDADELRRVRQLSMDAAPAHVLVSVVAANYPFICAVASLVGADTYLRAAEKPDAVRVGESQLGYVDTLQGLGTLDARLGTFGAMGDAGLVPRPVADAGDDREVAFGAPFTLDGSRSHAAPGHNLTEYRWRVIPPLDP